MFDWLAEFYLTEGARGWPDDPARKPARRHKRWTRDYLAGLAREGGLECLERLGSELLLLFDGASSRMVVDGGPKVAREVAEQARRIATILIGAAAAEAGTR